MNVIAQTSDAGLRHQTGPSALSGGGWSRAKPLIRRMARTEWTLSIHDTFLGYIWYLLGPLLTFTILYFAFTRVLRIGNEVHKYAPLLLFNIMLFHYFSQGVSKSMSSLVSNASILRQVEVPRVVLPLSMIATATVAMCFNMVVVLGFMLATGVEVRLTWLLIPVVVVLIGILATGLGLLLSVLNVRYRDISQAWSAFSRILFYGSPIIFTIEFYPDAWRIPLMLNPLAPILAQARIWFFDPNAPSFADVVGGPEYYLVPIAVFVATCAFGVWMFRRRAPGVAEEL